jgi:RHS repeat-associated protein
VKAEFDSDGNSVSYKYDPIGRQSEIRYDEQNSITYTYDKAGNRRTETYYAEGTQWSNTYDELGRLLSFKDPNNQVTQYEYHDDGQLKAVIDAKKGRTEYEYHEDGQLKSVKDALNQTTTYEYNDREGRITKIILPDTSKETTYTYDDTENSVTVKDFNGEEIKYVYDEAGSLLRKELLSLGTSVSYDYDEETRTETIVSARGTTVYQYDESGRLLSRKDPEGPYIDGDGASIEYVYDENRVTVKTSHWEIVYEYNEDGTLKSVTTPEGTTEYRYEDGLLVKTIFPNGTAEVIVYDPLGRIDVMKTVKIDPVTEAELEVLASYDYEVDDAGNREEVIDHNGRKVEYEYDELNRVIEEKISNPLDASEDGRTITYVYDAVGNLDYKGDTVAGDTDFVYNRLNQLVKSIYNGEETIYTYDDNGSLDTRVVGDYSVDYDWENDGENRLQSVVINDGGTITNIEYEYNEQGIRTSKKVNGVETNYLIDELQPYAQVLEEYDALGNLQNAYVYGNDLVSQSDNNETLFYHVDGLGSTRVLTDESGNIEESYNYDAYGNLIIGDASENAYLFAGEQRDIETGLDYLRARYYDPTLGRFISRDAYAGNLSDPMSQHKYQYAHANPVVNTDPSGYFTMKEILGALKISSILGAGSGAIIGGIADGWKGAAQGSVFGAIAGPIMTLGTIAGAYGIAASGLASVAVSTAYIGTALTVIGAGLGIYETITAETERQRLAAIASLILLGAGMLGARPQFNKFRKSYAGRGTFINKGKPPTNPGEEAELKIAKYLANRLKIDIIKVDPKINPSTGKLSSTADYKLRSLSGKTLELKTRTTANKRNIINKTNKNIQSENQVLVVKKGNFSDEILDDIGRQLVDLPRTRKRGNLNPTKSTGIQKDRIYIFQVDDSGNYEFFDQYTRLGVNQRLW